MAIERRERISTVAIVLWPIAGLIGGLFVGAIRAKIAYPDVFQALECVVKWGVTGSFAGMLFVVLLVFRGRRGEQLTIGRLMGIVAVSGLVTWFAARVLLGAIGSGGF